MKYTKRKPLHDKCEKPMPSFFMSDCTRPCGKTAKAERYFDNPKAKPMSLCGIHANQARRAGYNVKNLGETNDSK